MKDGVIFTSGNMVERRCFDAANILKDKYKIGVVNIPSIKPLDKSKILKIISKTKIFSVEDHSINGGLGSAILEIISNQNIKKPFFLHGLKDFTQSGEVKNYINIII